jgi:hypothetical protein
VTFSDVGSTPTASTTLSCNPESRAAGEGPLPARNSLSASSVPLRFNVLLVLVLVLFRNIVFRKLPGSDFALIGITGAFYAAERFGFHVLAFFQQLFHAFRIEIVAAREPLRIAGLPCGRGA